MTHERYFQKFRKNWLKICAEILEGIYKIYSDPYVALGSFPICQIPLEAKTSGNDSSTILIELHLF